LSYFILAIESRCFIFYLIFFLHLCLCSPQFSFAAAHRASLAFAFDFQLVVGGSATTLLAQPLRTHTHTRPGESHTGKSSGANRQRASKRLTGLEKKSTPRLEVAKHRYVCHRCFQSIGDIDVLQAHIDIEALSLTQKSSISLFY